MDVDIHLSSSPTEEVNPNKPRHPPPFVWWGTDAGVWPIKQRLDHNQTRTPGTVGPKRMKRTHSHSSRCRGLSLWNQLKTMDFGGNCGIANKNKLERGQIWGGADPTIPTAGTETLWVILQGFLSRQIYRRTLCDMRNSCHWIILFLLTFYI